MSVRYYLEIDEDGDRIPAGDRRGYGTLREAKEAARGHVDDALPRNTVRVMACMAEACLAGDGGTYVKDHMTGQES